MHKLQQRINQQQQIGLARKLESRLTHDLISNDYLGFAADEILKKNILEQLINSSCGSTGSRLLHGNDEIFEAVENLLAKFVNREAALIFPSGYQANVSLLSSLLQEGDLVFSDANNHASIIDGIKLSKAKKIIYPHNDLNFLEDVLKTQDKNSGLKVIVSESLFSMDGDIADLPELANLAEKYAALLIIDEAHTTGIYGASLVEKLNLTDKVFCSVHPAGKALGVSGAFIAGSSLIKNYLINFARGFIFSTAPTPMLAIALKEAVKYYNQVGETRAKIILKRSQIMREKLQHHIQKSVHGLILPIIIGDANEAIIISEQLRKLNWDVKAIRPPTVPDGTSRLRITIKWNNHDADLLQFVKDLAAFL